MKPSNNPDIALAQEWFLALGALVRSRGLKGYDPFDVKTHPWVRAVQPYALPRKLSTAACDLFPTLSRKMLHIAPTENPKAHALVATGCLRMHALTGEAPYLDRARSHLDWLKANASAGYTGLCWGYPWYISAKGLNTPEGTPVGVVSAIAGQAFLLAHEATGEDAFLDAAAAIAEFLTENLPKLSGENSTYCFGYTPEDRRRVHNANLLVAEHLFRTAALTGEDRLRALAEPALAYTLGRQREDGAWTYGEWQEDDPYEPGLLQLIDHHHTGFVLRSLHAIHEVRPGTELKESIQKGFAFYRTLFTDLGMPITAHGKYPVDIHACAEGILCPTVLSDTVLAARNLSTLTLRWTHYFLRDRDSGAPLYRKYPLFKSNISFPRWGLAWMYRAVAEYLAYHYPRA